MCKLTHQNISNYLSLLMAMYLYSAGAQIDAITWLNHIDFSVLCNALLRTLRNIKTSSAIFIKEKASNSWLVGTWDNFEYRKNIVGERIRDNINFGSITMVLWIKAGGTIFDDGLKHWI